MGAAGLHRAVCHSQLPSLSRQPPPIGRMDGRCAAGKLLTLNLEKSRNNVVKIKSENRSPVRATIDALTALY